MDHFSGLFLVLAMLAFGPVLQTSCGHQPWPFHTLPLLWALTYAHKLSVDF